MTFNLFLFTRMCGNEKKENYSEEKQKEVSKNEESLKK
jgi:hypothetical protein